MIYGLALIIAVGYGLYKIFLTADKEEDGQRGWNKR